MLDRPEAEVVAEPTLVEDLGEGATGGTAADNTSVRELTH